MQITFTRDNCYGCKHCDECIENGAICGLCISTDGEIQLTVSDDFIPCAF